MRPDIAGGDFAPLAPNLRAVLPGWGKAPARWAAIQGALERACARMPANACPKDIVRAMDGEVDFVKALVALRAAEERRRAEVNRLMEAVLDVEIASQALPAKPLHED